MKQKLLLTFSSLLVVGLMLIPSIGRAESTSTTAQINSLTALLQQIQTLQSQIDALKASQKALQTQTSAEFGAFLTSLSLGSEGDAVLALQALLAANPDIYPEGLITGYFGKATERALKRLQKENGLEQVGRVGPMTRKLLNDLLEDNPVAFEDDEDEDEDGDNNGKRLCAQIAPGHLIAKGWLKKHDGVRPIVPECQTLPKGIEKKLDGDWNPASTTPDTLAPSVRELSVTNISSTTASIVWNTNEKATSTIWYSTSTPVNVSTANTFSNSTWKTSHSYNLVGLTASTTYYYLVKVSDNKGNSTTTSESAFATLLAI